MRNKIINFTMRYINQFKLIQEIVAGKKPDAKKLLAEVDRQAVIRALKKSKGGLPKPFGYTDEPIEEENLAKMPQSDKKKLWSIYERIQKSPEKELPKLLELKKKHPNVPAIYNYICSAYAYSKQSEKYFNTLIETTQKFPDYLFGKTALAEYYLNNNKHKEVPVILDGKFEIYMHYPPTVKVFHVSEVRAFYFVTGSYYARVGKLSRALFCYFILNEVAPDHWATRRLGDEIIYLEIKKMRRKWKSKRV